MTHTSSHAGRVVGAHHAVLNALFRVVCLLCALPFSARAATVVAWGDNSSGQTTVPANVTNAIGIAAGYSHSVALNANGCVTIWGAQKFIPWVFGVTNAVRIAAGAHTSLALRADGTVFEVDIGMLPNNPPGLSNVMDLFVNHAYTATTSPDGCFALKTDGTLVSWTNAFSYFVDGAMAGANSATMVAAGQYHALTLEADGSVLAWLGYSDYGANSVPVALSNNVVAVAAGPYHSLALTLDGRVSGWGVNYGSTGLTNVPAGLSNVVDIAASPTFALALKSDGTVAAWGTGSPGVPSDLTNVVGISAGYGHALALVDPTNLAIVRLPQAVTGLPRQSVLLSVGVVSQIPLSYQWQFNGTDIPDATNAWYRTPALVSSVVGNYQVVVSNAQAVVTSRPVPVKMAGNAAVVWGDNRFGQTNAPSMLRARSLAAGGANGMALRVDGTVVSWGWNQYNQTNVPAGLTNVVAIAAGYDHELALRADGKVQAWGWNYYGQTTVPTTLSNVVAIGAGNGQSIALQFDGTVVQWGAMYGRIPTGLGGVSAVASGDTHFLGVKSDGTVAAWGTVTNAPPGLSNVVAVSGGIDFSLALSTDGRVTAWGQNDHGQCAVPADLSNVVAIAAGGYHAVALKSDGTAVAWGWNNYGQTNIPPGLSNLVSVAAGDFHCLLGIGDSDPAIARQPASYSFLSTQVLLSVGAISSRPVCYQWQHNGTNIAGATNATLVLAGTDLAQAGAYRVCVSNELGSLVSAPARVLLPGNRVVAWGANSNGETNVPPNLNACSVAAGFSYSIALQPDGTAVGWGYNGYKSLNIAPSATNLLQVADDYFATVGLRSDGSLCSWGLTTNEYYAPPGFSNISGDNTHLLALKRDGTMTLWTSAPPFSSVGSNQPLSNVVAIATGLNHYLAVKADGSVLAWGNNNLGQCKTPAGLTNVAAVAAGANHSLALTADGSVLAWGDNTYAQCGVPPNLTNAIAIAAGAYHSLALRRDGSVLVWGGATSAQRAVPGWLSNAVGIVGGGYHSLAVMDPRDPLIARQPCPASAFSGNPVLLTAGVRSAQPLAFQWQFNGFPIPAATNAWLYLPAVQAGDAGSYSVMASNALGSVTSAKATLTVLDGPPFILTQPTNVVLSNNPPAVFQVVADGSGALSYAWQKDGGALAAGTAATLTLPSPHRADSGNYSVLVSNAFGAVTSAPAYLRVLIPQQLSGPFVQSDGTLLFSAIDSDGGLLTNADASLFQLWSSTNLTTWDVLSVSPTLTNGILWLKDSTSTNYPQRFYRVVEQP